MRSNLKTKGYQFVLIAIFIFSSIVITFRGDFSLGEGSNQVEPYQITKINETELKKSTISGKISVNGNSGWLDLKNAGKCTGFGTSLNPYVIKDLVIDGRGSGSSITIENSHVHFKIENCYLYNLGELGIGLTNVDNGQLINNSILNGPSEGIHLENSNNNNISRNKLYNILVDGISVWNSDYNLISENIVINIGWGISLHSSAFNNISKNEVNNNINMGIELYDSNFNYMSENIINYNGGAGIILATHSNYNEVFNNTINSNEPGISIGSSNGNIITENSINDNSRCGIYIDDQSTCNKVSNNHFSGNIDDIQDLQGECPLPVEIAIALGIIITGGIVALGLIIWRRYSSNEVVRFKKHAKREAKKNSFIEKREEPSKLEVLESEEIKEVLKEEKEDILSPPKEKLNVVKIPEDKITGESQRETSAPDQMPKKEEEIVKDIIEVPKGEVIYCQFCGKELSNEMNICLECGNKVKK